MLFIYLYRGDLFSDLWKSDLYFRLASIFFFIILTSIKSVINLLKTVRAFKFNRSTILFMLFPSLVF